MVTLFALSKAAYNDVMKLFDGVLTDGDSFTYQPDVSTNGYYYPHPILIDFGTTYDIQQLKFKDDSGTPQFNVKAGNNPFSLTDYGNITCSSFGTYQTLAVGATAVRFLLITLLTNRSNQEIEIYGERVGSVWVPPTPTTRTPNFNGMLGVNAYMSVPANLLAPFKFIRNFTEASWFYDALKKYRASSAYSGGVNAEENLADFIAEGIEAIMVIQSSPTYLLNKDAITHDGDYKPILYSDSPDVVASYQEISERYFDFVAELGANDSLSTSLVDWQTVPRYIGDYIATPETGKNLLRRVEMWNEPGKTWKGISGHFTAIQNAMRESMAYDGHCGAYPRAGVKNADPTIKFISAGLDSVNLDYLKTMDYWYRYNRADTNFAADVIQIHFYANSAGGQYGGPSVGICPEEGLIYDQLTKIVEWRNKYRPTLDIMLGENGYELNQSDQRIPDIAGFTREQTAANWYLRSMLESFRAGIDEYYWFDFSDNPSVDGTETYLYTFCGMVTKEPNYVPKAAYYYAQQVSTQVKPKSYKLRSVGTSGGVRTLKLEDTVNGTELWFIWSPTGNNTVLTAQTVTDDTSFNTVTKGNYSYTSNAPVTSGLTKAGTYSVDVSERPTFLLFTTTVVTVTAVITSPTNGQTFPINQAINVTATASTSAGTMADVKFYIDDVLVSTDSSDPYAYTIGANTLSLGSHIIKILATNNTGETDLKEVTITINSVAVVYKGKKRGWF